MRLSMLLVVLLALVGGCSTESCAKAPPTLTPAGAQIWQANQAAVALGTLQHTAIELNKVQVCDPSPCRPLFSDANTGVVVDAVTDALTTLKAVPAGWKPTANAALDRVVLRLDTAGNTKLSAYVQAARTILDQVTQ